MQRWRVPLGFACAALFLLLARPRGWTLAVGGAVAMSGLALRGWASGHLRKNQELATTGPYAYTRNPLYLGSFLLGLGFTIAAGRLILVIVFAAMILGIYLPVMRVEAKTLSELFGAKYERYARDVPLILPRLSPYRNEDVDSRKFDRALYFRYREFRAPIGAIAGWGLLALKAIFFR